MGPSSRDTETDQHNTHGGREGEREHLVSENISEQRNSSIKDLEASPRLAFEK